MINNSLGAAAALALTLAACQAQAPTPEGFQGTVELDERVVAFEVAGRILAVPVHRGDVVKDGDVLAQVDDTLPRLTRDARADDANAARADLALLLAGARVEDVMALTSDVRAARVTEELLKKEAARTTSLQQSGALPQSQADKADSDLDRAVQQRKALEQRLASLQSGARPQEVTRAKARVESSVTALAFEEERVARCTLRTKGAGTVLDVHVEPGELAATGTPAVTLADVAHPYVDVFIAQGELDGVKVGAKVLARVDATVAPFPGAVEFVSPRTEFTPRFLFSERERPHLVVRVRVRLEDPEAKLHAGVPAFVRLVK
jgi:HlyD family secretion protein